VLILIALLAGLAVGVVVGLWIKPTRHEYCEHCLQRLGCHCNKEVDSGAPRSARRA